MSTEQPLDPSLIEQTKQQIRSLVGEIAQLSKTEISPEEFYSEFLTRVVSALAAAGGAVWTANQDGQLALQYQINLHETRLRESEEAQAQHGRLLYKVFSSGEGMLTPPHSGAGDEQQAANPTDFLLVFGLLKTDLETMGVVEIFQRSDAAPSAQKGYLRFLAQMCELAADFLKSRQLRHFSDRQVLWTQLEDFTRMVHASLDPLETAYTIANEGRRLIDCDRLSVAIRKGNRCKIAAISGQDVFDKRSNVVRLLGKLATAVTATGDAIWYTGDTQDLAPQVEKAVEEYVDEAHSKTVAILPLKRPDPPEDVDPTKRADLEEPVGALIVEQIEDSRVPSSMVQRVEVVSRHSSTAMANALEHQNLFLMPLWRLLGKTRWVLQARTLPKTISVGIGVLAVILFFVLWPAKFYMEAKGTLEPVERRNVFTDVDGRVDKLLVDSGQLVEAGQLLVQIRNIELETQIADVEGKRFAALQLMNSFQRNLIDESKMRKEQADQYRGQIAEKRAEVDSLNIQLALLKFKLQELSIKSPINGVVVTWDLRNRLIHRPVQRGQELMKVADPTGDWQLEIHMPENRMGNVAEVRQELHRKWRETLRRLLKEDLLAKLPAPSADAGQVETAAEAPLIPAPEMTAEQTVNQAEAAQSPAVATETAAEPAQTAAKVPDAREAEIDKMVEEELAKVSDEQLFNKQISVFNDRFHAGLDKIVENMPDGELKDKISEIQKEKSYDEARAKLKALMPEITDKELSEKLAALPSEEPETMKVAYILATESGKTRYGTVTEVQRSAEVRGEEGNTVLIKVAINKDELPDKRPGATVTAKVYCGRRPLGYVLLHDLIGFIQSKIIFRYF
jgi:multidrug efflux pump subunit AcrA (membrane-fusion protein)